MRRNYSMRKLQRRYRKPAELLLVPLIDIFTVLVTFLLITAVFSRTVIMELQLPGADAAYAEPPPGLQLEVILRQGGIVVADRGSGVLESFAREAGDEGYDLAGLADYLQFVKSRYPEKTDATLLLEKDISYDTLVQVMDVVRIVEVHQDGRLVQGELFPDVSIGDAPGGAS